MSEKGGQKWSPLYCRGKRNPTNAATEERSKGNGRKGPLQEVTPKVSTTRKWARKPPSPKGVVAQYCCYETNFSIFLLLLRPRTLFSRLNEKMRETDSPFSGFLFCEGNNCLLPTFYARKGMIYLLVIEALRRVNCSVDDLLT